MEFNFDFAGAVALVVAVLKSVKFNGVSLYELGIAYVAVDFFVLLVGLLVNSLVGAFAGSLVSEIWNQVGSYFEEE